MNSANKLTVERVYSEGMCNSCGLCEGNCSKNAITYIYNARGFLRPIVDTKKCTKCGLCTRLCPGNKYFKNDLSCSANKSEIWYGSSTNKKVCRDASSGGITTELLLYMLRHKIVDYCMVVPPVEDINKVNAIVTNEPDVLYKSMTSKYCPIRYGEALKKIDPLKYKYAIVGLPCQIASLRKKYEKYKDCFIFIALICNHLPSANATKFLYENYRISSPSKVKYRGYGWPGYIRIIQDNESLMLPYRRTWSMTGFGKYFYNTRCKICNDPLGESSDISVGDAYFLNEKDMKSGQTMCMIRNMHTLEILKQMVQEGVIQLNKLEDKYKFEKAVEPLRIKVKAISKQLKIMEYLHLKIPDNSEKTNYQQFSITLKDIYHFVKMYIIQYLVSSNIGIYKLIWKFVFIKSGGKKLKVIRKTNKERDKI